MPAGDEVDMPAGQWHSLRCLESGTVLLEAKDGKWEPLGEGEVMEGEECKSEAYVRANKTC